MHGVLVWEYTAATQSEVQGLTSVVSNQSVETFIIVMPLTKVCVTTGGKVGWISWFLRCTAAWQLTGRPAPLPRLIATSPLNFEAHWFLAISSDSISESSAQTLISLFIGGYRFCRETQPQTFLYSSTRQITIGGIRVSYEQVFS